MLVEAHYARPVTEAPYTDEAPPGPARLRKCGSSRSGDEGSTVLVVATTATTHAEALDHAASLLAYLQRLWQLGEPAEVVAG